MSFSVFPNFTINLDFWQILLILIFIIIFLNALQFFLLENIRNYNGNSNFWILFEKRFLILGKFWKIYDKFGTFCTVL